MQTTIESNDVIPDNKILNRQKSTTTATKLPTYIVAFSVSENKEASVDVTAKNTQQENSFMSPTISTEKIKIVNLNQTTATTDISDTQNEKFCDDVEKESSQILLIATSQAQILFDCKKKAITPKFDARMNRKKGRKYNRTVIDKNVHFINEHAGMNMTRKLKKYYMRTKNNLNNLQQIQTNLCCNTISKRVSRKCILKKQLAKKYLLSEAETYSFERHSLSVSNSSQGTLTREDSSLSRNYDVTTTNSVIQVKDNKILPYKTDILNVAVAQVNNTPNIRRNSFSTIIPQRERDFTESLTSTETAFSETIMLTSKCSFQDPEKSFSGNSDSDAAFSSDNISDETLMPPNKLSETSNDTFEIAKTSSFFRDSNMQSDCTLKYQDVNMCFKDFQINDKNNDVHTSHYYNAIMNVYSKIAPGSTSARNFPNNDNVIIAEEILKSPLGIQKQKNRGDERFTNVKNDYHTNIFQKPLHAEDAVNYQNNIYLPNATQIKNNNNMVDPSRSQKKISEEARNACPTSFPELFDKLTIVLEIAVKRLEQTLSEKIVSELRKSLHEFKNQAHPIPNFDLDLNETMSKNIVTDNLKQSNITLEAIPQLDACMQCEIVQNEVIDKLMTDFIDEVAKSCIQSSSNCTQKLKKPKLLKDYFEVLKAPVPSHFKEAEVGKGDSIQVSIEDVADQRSAQFDCTKQLFSIPKRFVRENMFVITSVPAFLFVMFVIYAYVLLIFKMW